MIRENAKDLEEIIIIEDLLECLVEYGVITKKYAESLTVRNHISQISLKDFLCDIDSQYINKIMLLFTKNKCTRV